jgi:hypothetical protein
MNRRSEEYNPLGSPFFNHFIEVNLGPFSYKDVGVLLDTFLNGSGIQFNPTDRNFIVWLSGRHPFRMQLAGAALFDAISDGLEGEKRYAQTAEWFYERTKDHFSTLWRRYLTEADQTVMVIIGLVELGGVAQKRRFAFGEIEQSQRFAPELLRLEKLGLVEKIGKGWQWDKEHLLLWQGERWRVASNGFVGWLANVVIGGAREIPDFEQWLHDKEKVGYLLTRKQIELMGNLVKMMPQSVVSGAGTLARQFVSELLSNRS